MAMESQWGFVWIIRAQWTTAPVTLRERTGRALELTLLSDILGSHIQKTRTVVDTFREGIFLFWKE